MRPAMTSKLRTMPLALPAVQRDVDKRLARLLPRAGASPQPLSDAMRYAVLGGGKRVRPYLVCAAALHGSPDRRDVLDAAAAVEMVHAFSLVHDDLPAIDNDDTRRGRPTLHVAYGEGVAILAGDALLARAFEVMGALASRPSVGPKRAAAAVQELASAVGFAGLVGGETADVLAAGHDITAAALRSIHARKTARLFEASARLGGLVAGARAAELTALAAYGSALGHAFQIADDVRDEGEAPPAPEMPRPTGAARAVAALVGTLHLQADKPVPPSLPRIVGLVKARVAGRRALSQARAAAERLPRARASLLHLADLVEERLG